MSIQHSPQGSTKSPTPTGAAASPTLDITKTHEKPSLKKPPDPLGTGGSPSLLKTITSGIKRKTYSLSKISEVLASVSKQLNEYKVLPLPENYARELSHGVDIDSLAIQKIVDQTKINPFTYFTFTENVSTEKVPSDESFIYFGGQLFFNRHQLSAPI